MECRPAARHRRVAQLGLPVPREEEFVSAQVVPALPGIGKPLAEMDGRLWSVASPEDPVHRAPELPSQSASSDHFDGSRWR
ncbi:NaeI family type II restriction endonuclease [Streptomyces niveus]|uniref:NaeI family type II restriction endonuclease n=1 Tax=Streptomyces niveus TaxID=193462 RepID=UPI00363A596A